MTKHAEIAARLAAATPGPWVGVIKPNGKGPGIVGAKCDRGTGKAIAVVQSIPGGEQRVANTHLIGNAPSDIAFLLAEITRLEAERDEANDEITDPWLCGIIRGLEWRASELEAEIATLREAAQRLIDNAGGLAVTNTSARQLVQIEDVRSLTAALATPTATAREGEPSE